MKQVESGKAFEYGMITQIERILECEIERNTSLEIAEKYYANSTFEEQNKILKCAVKVIVFLLKEDGRLHDGKYRAFLQADAKGRKGDVRDIIIHDTERGYEIGLSLKNRHSAVKHSRLSESIDFGKEWIGLPNTRKYKNTIAPIFGELRERQKRKELWRDVPDKDTKFYLPILYAFRDELLELYKRDNKGVSLHLLSYLIGKYDFYKVIKENGAVSILSFNLLGSLEWGKKIPTPTRIIEAELKENSNTTLILVFNHGWQISFRIHNASSRVEPSLKFDIQVIGYPPFSRYEVNYMRE